MEGKTHVIFNLILYFIIVIFFTELTTKIILVGSIIVLLYSKIPDVDLDLPFIKHRGVTHNLIGLTLFTIPMWVVDINYGIISTGTLISHIVTDWLF